MLPGIQGFSCFVDLLAKHLAVVMRHPVCATITRAGGLITIAIVAGVLPHPAAITDILGFFFSKLLGLPEHVIPLAFVVIGHPKTEQKPMSRFDPAKVRRNGWA